jgi:hypothetical protein
MRIKQQKTPEQRAKDWAMHFGDPVGATDSLKHSCLSRLTSGQISGLLLIMPGGFRIDYSFEQLGSVSVPYRILCIDRISSSDRIPDVVPQGSHYISPGADPDYVEEVLKETALKLHQSQDLSTLACTSNVQ